MQWMKALRLSPGAALALAGLILATAALAISLGGRATATTAELSKVGKLQEKKAAINVQAGATGKVIASCKGKTKAISGGFDAAQGLEVLSSTPLGNKKWEVRAFNPTTDSALFLGAIALCAK